jgi:integrase
MTDLKVLLKEKRPNLSESSINTYNSILRTLHNKVFGGEIDAKHFEDSDKIIEYLKTMRHNYRKTVLASLVVITDDKKYRDLMNEDIETYKKGIDKQEKSPKEEENWVGGEDIKKLWESLKANADLLYKKKQLTAGDLQEIQSFIILSLMGGLFIPPRRSKDYCDFKIKEVGDNHNHLDKNTMVFVSYKTAKTYGEQRVELPKALKSILVKWIKHNPTDWLFFDSNMNALTAVKLNQRLNKLFGKKVGANMLRKSFLTEKYADHSKKQKDLVEDMTQMGSSINQENHYIKLD